MRTRIKILLLVLLLLFTFGLYACGGGSSDSGDNGSGSNVDDNNNNGGNNGGTVIEDPIKLETFIYHFYGDEYTEELDIQTTDLNSARVKVGNVYQRLNRATRVGYKFEGAFSASEGKGIQYFDSDGHLIEGLAITEGIEIYAYWSIKSYTLIFNANGDRMKEIPCNYGQVYSLFDIPYKDGYIFTGWYYGEKQITNEYGYCLSDTQAVSEKTYDLSSGVIILEAHFEVIKYTVTFDYGGYQENESIRVDHGSQISSLPNVNKEYSDAELLGWSLTPNSEDYYNIKEPIRSDVTLYAHYKYFKIYSLVWNGEQIGSMRVYQGESFQITEAEPNLPQGYKMVDAYSTETYSGGSKISSITYYLPFDTLYILLEPITYNINYVLQDDETIIEEEYQTTFNCEVSVQLPTVSKEHCIFLGWSKEQSGGRTLTVDGAVRMNEYNDVSLYPVFKGENALLHLYTSVDSFEPIDQYSEYGKAVKLIVPTMDDYKFAGYYYNDGDGNEVQFTDASGVGLDQLKDMELSLYAHWNKKHYIEVSANPEGLVSVATAEYYVKGDQVVLQTRTPQFYDFVGWSEVDLKGEAGEIISTNLTYRFVLDDRDYKLVAIFKPKEYTVTLNPGEGAICTAKTVKIEYNSSFIIPIAARDGYLFEGWYYGDTQVTDGDGIGAFLWNISGNNITLTAKLSESDKGYKLITNLDDLNLLKTNPAGKYYLTCNLVASNWEPAEFSGLLNGGGFTISGLSSALFTKLTGKVTNLVLDVNIDSTSDEETNIGALCAELTGTASFITVKGRISAYGSNVGAVAGLRSKPGTIDNCTNNAIIIGNASNVGGILGKAAGDTFVISNCTNNASITGNNCVGGIVGFDNVITNTYTSLKNNGEVKGNDNVGGVIGKMAVDTNWDNNYACTLSTLKNTATILGNKNVGGIIGHLSENDNKGSRYIKVAATKLDNTGNVTGTECVGGLIGYAFHDVNVSGLLSDSSSSAEITALYKVGGLVGWIDNGLDIVNSSNEGSTITATSYYTEDSVNKVYLGGYVGRGASIGGCVNKSIISYAEKGNYVGGIAGFLYWDTDNCSNIAEVYAPNSNYVGGIAGYINQTNGNKEFASLSNLGKVTGTNYVGGIAGAINQSINVDANYTVTFAKLSNAGEITGAKYTAGIIGYLYQNNTNGSRNIQIKSSQLNNTGNVTGTEYVGGLIGYVLHDPHSTGSIVDSSSNASITASYKIGGLIGWVDNGFDMSNCSNEGSTITATGYYIEDSVNKVFLGGYAGRISSISGCVNKANITYTEKGSYVGGIAGVIKYNINNCSNSGTILASNASYVGGLVGFASQSTGNKEFANLTNTGNVTGANYVGGITGSTDQTISSDANYTATFTKLSNAGVITGAKYVGGISGYLCQNNTYGSRYIQIKSNQFTNTGDVTGTDYVGGLLGYAYQDPNANGNLIDSSSNASITALYKIGGLVGWIDNNIELSNCSNEGSTITATSYYTEDSTNKVYLGGYVGRGSIVSGCINKSDITYTEKGNYVGGIAGLLYIHINSSSNSGIISAPNSSYVGGLVGYVQQSTGNRQFTDLANTGKVTGTNYVGGIAGSINQNISSDANYTVTFTMVSNTAEVSGAKYTGGIVGYLYQNNTYGSRYIQIKSNQLSNTGKVTGTEYVGGLLGYVLQDPNASGNIIDSSSSASVTALYKVGGLVGWADNGFDMSNCTNEGATVTATSYFTEDTVNKVYLGGYIGRGATVTGCINKADITYTEKGRFVGGIAGYIYWAMSSCSNSGAISAPNSDYVGGLAGYVNTGNSGNKTFANLENSGSVTGNDYVGGMFGGIYSSYSVDGSYVYTLTVFANTGNITGNKYVGGMIGSLYGNNTYGSRYIQMKASQFTNTADVVGKDYIGGLIGYVYEDQHASGNIVDSSSSGSVSALYRVGGLIGWAANGFDISNCSNEGATITATSYYTEDSTNKVYVGGYIGNGASVSDCINKADIIYNEKGYYVGGIAGYLYWTINNCSNSGEIKAPNSSFVGGLVGYIYTGNSGNKTFANLTNSGKVTGADYVGGIAGRIYTSFSSDASYTYTLSVLENTGAISGNKYTAGIIGSLYANDTYGSRYIQLKTSRLTNTGNVTGSEYVGGLLGYVYEDPHANGSLLDSSSKASVTALHKIGGLVGWIDNNVELNNCSNEGSTITATSYFTVDSVYKVYLGGYVGYGSVVTGCINKADIIYNEKGNYVGGIAGFLYWTINNSSNSGIVSAPNSNYVGGLVGDIYTGNTGNKTFANLTNSGKVTGGNYVGGIAGRIYTSFSSDANYAYTLSVLENSGEITGNKYTAGIIGSLYANDTYGSRYIQTKANQLANTGKVTGSEYVGGLLGYVYHDPHISGNIADSSSGAVVTALYRVGGLIGWADNGFDVNNCSNEGSTITATSYYTEDSVYKVYLGGYIGNGSSVSGCENKSNIVYTEKGNYVGGIAGNLYWLVSNCTNSGEISAPNSNYVGGLVGNIQTGNTGAKTFANLKNSGKVTGVNYVGGIIGRVYTSFSSDANYAYALSLVENTGEITGENYVAGIAGYFYANNTYGSRNIQVKSNQLTNTGNINGKQYVAGLFGYDYHDPHASGSIIDSTIKCVVNVEAVEGNNVSELIGKLDNTVNMSNNEVEVSIVETTPSNEEE